jgi:hypothetical protein
VALKEISRETGAPVAELARRAVDAFLTVRIPGYTPGSRYSEPVPYESAITPLTTHP